MGESRSAVARGIEFESSSRSGSLLEHDLFRKPASSPDQVRAKLFRDHALARRHVAFVPVAAEWPALEPVADRIGRKLGLSGKRGLAVVFATALGVITETKRRLIVPPASVVVGGAIEDLVADVGMLEPDTNELHQILGLDPDRQPPPVDRGVGDVADAEAGHAQ